MNNPTTINPGNSTVLGKLGKISLGQEQRESLFRLIETIDDDIKDSIKYSAPFVPAVGQSFGSETRNFFGEQGAAKFIAILNLIKLHSFKPQSRTVLSPQEIEFLTLYVPERLMYTSAYLANRKAGSPHIIKKLMELAEKFIEFRELLLIPIIKQGNFLKEDADLI